MDQVLLSVPLPIVCGSQFNGTTHMCVCIPHLKAHHYHAKSIASTVYHIWCTLTHCCGYWCRHTILCHISVMTYTLFQDTPLYGTRLWLTHYCRSVLFTDTLRHTIRWHTSTLLWGTLPNYRKALYCVAQFHTIVGHTAILSCGTLPRYCEAHYCVAHFQTIVRHTIVGHINLGAGQQPSGQGELLPLSWKSTQFLSSVIVFVSWSWLFIQITMQWNRSQWTICHIVLHCMPLHIYRSKSSVSPIAPSEGHLRKHIERVHGLANGTPGTLQPADFHFWNAEHFLPTDLTSDPAFANPGLDLFTLHNMKNLPNWCHDRYI